MANTTKRADLRVAWLKHEPATLGYLGPNGWQNATGDRTMAIRSPIDDQLLGHVAECTADDALAAAKAAKAAQPGWAAKPLHERVAILQRAAELIAARSDDLIEQLILDVAKPRDEAKSEVTRTAEFVAFAAEAARAMGGELLGGDAWPRTGRDKLALVTREPWGVVLAIAPFNYPLNLSVSKIAPALVTGNAVVFKPPCQGAIVGLQLGAIFQEAGVPPGVFSVVTGRSREIGDPLLTSPDVDFVSFTGSTSVGEHIAQLSRFRGLQLELGGKDAAIVLEDAPLDKTVAELAKGGFKYSGQRCTSVKRVIVLEAVADALAPKLAEAVKAFKVGDPREAGVTIGPLIDDDAAERVWNLIQEAIAQGAVPLTEPRREGRLLWPVLLDRVTPEMRVAWEEPFGPVLPILRVASEESALELANRSRYGLQSCVFTRDYPRALRLARRLQVGTVNVNGEDSRGPDHFPFSGVKDSGFGAQGVGPSLEAMTRPKAIVLNLPPGTW